MKNSLKIARPFGISIYIHWTFLFIIAWIVAIDIGQGFNTGQILMSVLFVLTLFICVVLHELGHSLTAKALGGEVKSITLLPIGGMANIKKMPDKPKEEFLITIAGLAVNVVIALILWVVLSSLGRLDFQDMDFQAITAQNFFVMLMAVNLFIVAFNLIPAFPMDGGRILRSLLSFKMSKVKATRISKSIGKTFGVLFAIAGLFYNPFLVIIGIFVFIGAQAEYEMIKYHDLLENYKVKDVINNEYTAFEPNDPLEKAAHSMIHGSDNGFVILSGSTISGILTKKNIIKGLSTLGNQGKVKEVMVAPIKPVDLEMPLNTVFQKMMRNKYEILPVQTNGHLEGVLDLENIKELVMVLQAEGTT
jgi:Zn-dependent protease